MTAQPMDGTGRTRTEYSAEEIAQFDESKAERLADLLEAEKQLNAATDAAQSIALAKDDAVKARDKFQREGQKRFPPKTQHEAYMEYLRATSPSHAPQQKKTPGYPPSTG